MKSISLADMEKAHCNKCKKKKPKTEKYFYFVKGKFNGGYCRPCTKQYKAEIQARQNVLRQSRIKSDPDLLAHIRHRDRTWRRSKPALHLLRQAKNRAKRLGYSFNLKLEDIVIPDLCPLLEVPFVPGTQDDYKFTYSLDRLDSTKGYVKGNVKVISKLANSMKNEATKEELLIFAKNILNYLNQDQHG